MRRSDLNQSEIVSGLREIGCSVLVLSNVGHGCPDICVSRAGSTMMMEIKSAKGKLTPDEEKFISCWRGRYAIVRSLDEAIEVVRQLG